MSKSAIAFLILVALITSRELEPVNMPAVTHAKVVNVTPPDSSSGILAYGGGGSLNVVSVQGSVPLCVERNGSCWTDTTNKVVYPVTLQPIPPQSAPTRP